jgi:hypothetical protein
MQTQNSLDFLSRSNIKNPMKTRIVAAFLVAGLLFGCNATKESVILDVLKGQEAASAKMKPYRNSGLPALRTAHKVFSSDVANIDAAHCPEDFRLAWFDFVESARNVDRAGLLGIKAAMEKQNQSYAACERVAIKYGITFKPQD